MVELAIDIVGAILYPMLSIIYLLLFFIQQMFTAFAGTGDVRYGGYGILGSSVGSDKVDGEDGGIVYYLFQSDLVKNLLISIMVLALVLLVIFTILAFLKNMYSAKPRKWQEIIGDSIKALGLFIAVPVLCLLGVWVGNVILNAINSATNTTSNDNLNGMLFKCVSYNANKVRLDDDFTMDDLEALRVSIPRGDEYFKKLVYDSEGNLDQNYYAEVLDNAYAENMQWQLSHTLVRINYSIGNMNYLILIGGGLFLLYAMCAITFGMIKRMFMLLVLYVISPVMVALYPIKGDGPLKSWTGDFVKQTISAYGAVAGMNIMFALLPIMQNIKIPLVSDFDYLGIIPILLTIAGLYMVNDVIGLISGYIGADNAYSVGTGLMGSVKGRVQSTNKRTKAAITGVSGAFARANMAKKAVADDGTDRTGRGAWWASMGGSIVRGLGTAGEKTLGANPLSDWDAGVKAGKKAWEEDKKNKLAVEYNTAVSDQKDAKEALKNLTDLSGGYQLKDLATKYAEVGKETEYKEALVKRAKDGLTYTDEDMEGKSYDERKRMRAENSYITKVYAQQEKISDAQYIIDSYKDTTAAAYKEAHTEKKKGKKSPKATAERVEESTEAVGDTSGTVTSKKTYAKPQVIRTDKVDLMADKSTTQAGAAETVSQTAHTTSDKSIGTTTVEGLNDVVQAQTIKAVLEAGSLDEVSKVIENAINYNGANTIAEIRNMIKALEDLKQSVEDDSDESKKIKKAIETLNDQMAKFTKKDD